MALLSTTLFAKEKRMLIATDEEKRGGYLVAVSSEALRRAGYQVEIHYLPWKRALLDTMKGQYDMLLGAYYATDRIEKLAYSEPVGKVEVGLWALKDKNIRYDGNLIQLSKLRIGKTRGAAVSEAFDQAKFLQVEEVTEVGQNIKKLLANRLDAFVDKKITVQHILARDFKNDLHRIEFVYPPLRQDYFYNAFSKSRPGYQERVYEFNRALTAIHRDGTYDQLLVRYGASE